MQEYNILKIAGPCFGTVLYEETKKQISKVLKNWVPYWKYKAKMSLAAKGKTGYKYF